MLRSMTSRPTIVSVVGTRPNMMKIAPIAAELAQLDEFRHVLVHSGQHYDHEMSGIFIDELDMEPPMHFLDVGAGTHAQQTARVMERLEPLLCELRPDLVLVPGDVNSTLGAALTAAKLGLPVGHVEAGLRSFDRTMPEELNRILTDQVSSVLFIHSPEAEKNLLAEGRPHHAIFNVGNTMIDSLVRLSDAIARRPMLNELRLRPRRYIVVTFHRPALVESELFHTALSQLRLLSKYLPVVFPVHPRTQAAMGATFVDGSDELVRLLPPLGYLDFLSLVKDAAAVLTDSGGIQEETTYLGIPCFTLRDSTERPVTIELGTNVLLGLAPERIADIPRLIEARRGKTGSIPPLWDGRAAVRIAEILRSAFSAGVAASPTNAVRGPTSFPA